MVRLAEAPRRRKDDTVVTTVSRRAPAGATSAPEVGARDTRGRRGFGHTQDRSEVVPAEAELITDAARQVLGGATLSSIVDDWNRRGVTTTTGGPWRINALSALLIQPRLAGEDLTGANGSGERVPAILDRSTHEALVALRHGRRKRGDGHSPGGSGRRYLLTGFLRCWRCGSRLGGITPSAATVQAHYRCPSRGAGGCSGVVVHAARVEEAVRDAVVVRVDDPEFIRFVDAQEARITVERASITALITDAVTGGTRNGNVPELWADGDRINNKAWKHLKEQLEEKTNGTVADPALQCRFERQRQLRGSGKRLGRDWDGMSLEERRSTIEAVVDHFVVQPAPRLRSRFTADRLQAVWR